MQVSKFLFNMGSKRCPVAHAKLSLRQSRNFMPPCQHFPLQKHHSNLDLFSQVRDTTHSTELLHSKEPITQFGRVAIELIWFVNLHFGPLNSFWTRGRLLWLVSWSISHLKLSMPSSNHFLDQSLDGWVHVCHCGSHLLKQILVGQTLYVHCHCC